MYFFTVFKVNYAHETTATHGGSTKNLWDTALKTATVNYGLMNCYGKLR